MPSTNTHLGPTTNKFIGNTDEKYCIAASLKEKSRWILWKAADGQKKPVDPHSKVPTNCHNTKIQYPFDTAKEFSKKSANLGMGFVISDSPYVLIDADNARNPASGKIHPRIKSLIEEANSYAAVSVSGTGIHILVKGEKPGSFGGKYLSEKEKSEFPDAKL